ncbi:MAG: hypothetical protein LBS17_03370 [Actinomycetes bacterium]|jgi:urease accessory protein|nr:hypothetical protein [Actinomycetes bacterium]
MIVSEPIGRADEERFGELVADPVHIEWYNTQKAVDVRRSSKGTEIGLRPNEDTLARGWYQGDVLYADDEVCVMVVIDAGDCIAISAPDAETMLPAVYEIGNRHAPLFSSAGNLLRLLTPYEEPLMRLLAKLPVSVERCEDYLLAEYRISNTKGHSHAHDDGGYDGHGGAPDAQFYAENGSGDATADADDVHNHEPAVHIHEHGHGGHDHGHSHSHAHDHDREHGHLNHNHSHGCGE